MGHVSTGMVAKGLRTVFAAGSAAGLTDAQLLERFVAGQHKDKDGGGGGAGASFEALLARHGPMVLGVCRAVLRDDDAADDAFQATFLVLVRRAGSVRVGDSLGRWLYGVAHKVAVRARTDAARRTSRERPLAGAVPDECAVAADPGANSIEAADLRAALHEELARLPEPARAAIVLCYLEGLTHEEAARRLGWPVGTVRSRLARARDRLRARLARRGLDPAPAVALLIATPPAAVPERLAAATAALAARSAEPLTAGAVPAAVLTLTNGVLHAMTLTKLTTAALALLAGALLSIAGAGVYAYHAPDEPDKPAPQPAAGPVLPETTADPGPMPDGTTRNRAPLVTERSTDEATPAVNVVATPELAAQLDLARKRLALVRRNHPQRIASQTALDEAEGQVQRIASQTALDEAEGQVRILEGRIAGRAAQLQEELELLKVRLAARRAELEQATAQVDLVKAKVAARRAEPESEAEIRREVAARDARAADVQEVEVQINQAERRLLALAPLLQSIKVGPAPAPQPPPPAPPSR